MRQVALIVVLAQAGSFVPAQRARIGLVDRLFTRVGAADDLARGQSTFMVEMAECARILHQATPRSLLLLDEVGRGTSTFDGLALAWAIAEHLHDVARSRTLFATHYHELCDLAREKPHAVNLTMAVSDVGGRVVFLRKVVPGAASRSYGIHVARLAGLPEAVLLRAREILGNLEAQELDEAGHPALASARQRSRAQLGLFGEAPPAPRAPEPPPAPADPRPRNSRTRCAHWTCRARARWTRSSGCTSSRRSCAKYLTCRVGRSSGAELDSRASGASSNAARSFEQHARCNAARPVPGRDAARQRSSRQRLCNHRRGGRGPVRGPVQLVHVRSGVSSPFQAFSDCHSDRRIIGTADVKPPRASDRNRFGFFSAPKENPQSGRAPY